jgi:hypothetical protein
MPVTEVTFMKNMLNAIYARPLAVYLIVALLAISAFAGPAEAMFFPSAPQGESATAPDASVRAADLIKIQSALESKIVSQRLLDYGLSPDEAMVRVSSLSDDQVHQLATHTDSLQAGGDAVGFVVGVLIVALLVVLLIYLVQGRIVIK